jgi:hypothetical protein
VPEGVGFTGGFTATELAEVARGSGRATATPSSLRGAAPASDTIAIAAGVVLAVGGVGTSAVALGSAELATATGTGAVGFPPATTMATPASTTANAPADARTSSVRRLAAGPGTSASTGPE